VVKKSLTDGQMSSVAYIDKAAETSRALTWMKCRGTGDVEAAMHRIEQEYGIPYSTTWQLRYRKWRVKSLAWDVVERIKAAYAAERAKQARKLAHESYVAARLGVDLGPEAESLVDEPQGETEL
jgi:hypothetical protein